MIGAITLDDRLRRISSVLPATFANHFFIKLHTKLASTWYATYHLLTPHILISTQDRHQIRGLRRTHDRARSGRDTRERRRHALVPAADRPAREEKRASPSFSSCCLGAATQTDRACRRQVREVVWRKAEVLMWVAPPTALMVPHIVGRVVWHALSKRLLTSERPSGK